MISKQLLEYIEKEDKLGKSKREIKEILASAGWHKDAISEAFSIYYKGDKKGKKIEIKSEDTGLQTKETKKLSSAEPFELEPPHDMLLETKDSAGKDIKSGETPEAETAGAGAPVQLKAEDSHIKKKKKVRPVFLVALSFVLGAAAMFAVSVFFLKKPAETVNITLPQKEETEEKETGFEVQVISDGERVARVLDIQEQLEKYYNEHKSYPENLSPLSDIPIVSSDINYAYTPIGSPPQSYTLSMETKSLNDGEFKVNGGFMTLKNKQGTK